MAAKNLHKTLTLDVDVTANEASINALAAKLSKRFKAIEDNSQITINTENVKGLERLLSIFQRLDSELTDVKKHGGDVKAVLQSTFGNAISGDINKSIKDFSELGDKTASFVNRINGIGKDIGTKDVSTRVLALARDINKAFEAGGMKSFINLEDFNTKDIQAQMNILINATSNFTSAWAEGLLQMGHMASGVESSMKEVASGAEKAAKNVDKIGKSNGIKQLNKELDDAKKRLDRFSTAYKNLTTFDEGVDAMLTGVKDSELEGHLTKVKHEYEEALKGYAQYTRGVKEGTATAEQGRKALERLAVAANEVLKINNSRAYNKVNNKQLKQWYQASGDGDKKQWDAVERAIKKGGLGVQEALKQDVIRLQQQVEVDVQPKVDGDTKGKVKKAVENAVPDRTEVDMNVELDGKVELEKLKKSLQELFPDEDFGDEYKAMFAKVESGAESAENALKRYLKMQMEMMEGALRDEIDVSTGLRAKYDDVVETNKELKQKLEKAQKQSSGKTGTGTGSGTGTGDGSGSGSDNNAPWARENTLQTTNKALDNINEGIGKLIQEAKQEDPKKKAEDDKDKTEDKTALEMQKKMKHLEGMNKVLQDEISGLKAKMKDDEPKKKVDVDGEDGEGQLVKTLSSINETLGRLNGTLKASDDPENKKSITIDGMESITGDINSILGVLKGEDGNESKLNATLGSIDGALSTLNATLKTPDEQKVAKPIVVEGISDISGNVGNILGILKGDEESSLSKQATQALLEASKAINRLVGDDDNKNALKDAQKKKQEPKAPERHDDAFDDEREAEKEAAKLVNDFAKQQMKTFATLQKDGTVAFNSIKEAGNVITKISGILTKKGIDDESLRFKTHISGDTQADLAKMYSQIMGGGIDKRDSQLQSFAVEYKRLEDMAAQYAAQDERLSEQQIRNWNSQIKLVKDLGNTLMGVMKKQGLFDVDLVKENSTKQLDVFVEKMQKAGMYSKEMQDGVADLRKEIRGISDADSLDKFANNFEMLKVDYEIAIEKQKEYNALLKQFKQATDIRFKMIGMDEASTEFADLKQRYDTLMKDFNTRSQALGGGQFDTRSGVAKITASALKDNISTNSKVLDKFVEGAKKAGIYTEELEQKVEQLKSNLMKLHGVNQFESWVADMNKLQAEYDETIAAQKEYNSILKAFQNAEEIRFKMLGVDETSAEFTELQRKYDAFMDDVNAKGARFTHKGFDLAAGKAKVSDDVFGTGVGKQSSTLDKLVESAKKAGVYTEELENKVSELKLRLQSLDGAHQFESWIVDLNRLQKEYEETVAAQKEYSNTLKVFKQAEKIRFEMIGLDESSAKLADLQQQYKELLEDFNKRSQAIGRGKFDLDSDTAKITTGVLNDKVSAKATTLDKFVESAKKAGVYTEELEGKVNELRVRLMSVNDADDLESWITYMDWLQKDYDKIIADQKEYNNILKAFRQAEEIRFKMTGIDKASAEFVALQKQYDEFIADVNARSKAFANKTFDLKAGKAKVTDDVFGTGINKQAAALDNIINGAKKAGIYTEELGNKVSGLKSRLATLDGATQFDDWIADMNQLQSEYDQTIAAQKEYNDILKTFRQAQETWFKIRGISDTTTSEYSNLVRQHASLMDDVNARSKAFTHKGFDLDAGMANVKDEVFASHVDKHSAVLDGIVEGAKKAGIYTEDLEKKVKMLNVRLTALNNTGNYDAWINDVRHLQREYDKAIAAQKEYNGILETFRKTEEIRFKMTGLDKTSAEFADLQRQYNEFMADVNVRSGKFRHQNFDLGAGKAKITNDILGSNISSQAVALDGFVEGAKKAGVYTEALESKVGELKSKLVSLKDFSQFEVWSVDMNQLQAEFNQTIAAQRELAAAQKDLNELIQLRKKIGAKEAQLYSNTITSDIKDKIKEDIGSLSAEDELKTKNLGSYSKSILDAIGAAEKLSAVIREVEQDIANASAQSKTAFAGFADKFDDISRGYQKLSDSVKGFNFDTDQADDLQKYQEAYKKLIDLKQKFEAKGKADLTDTDRSEWKSAIEDLNKYEQKIKDVVKASEKLRSSAKSVNDIEEIIDRDIINDLEELERRMTEFARSMDLGELSDISFDRELKELTATAKDSSGAIKQVKVALDSVNPAFVRSATAAKQTQSSWGKFMSSMKNKTREMAAYFMTFGSFYDIINVVRNGVISVKEIDDALTELKKVTDETDASYAKFLQTMSQTGANIGATVKDLTTSAAEWARLGYSMEESAKLAESTAVLMNVSEFDNATDASEALISTMQAFQYTAEDSQHVVDILNEVGNNYAVSSDGLAVALQDSASALAEGGNNLEKSVALIASANRVAQDPSSVGNALRTISLRLRGTSLTVLEEMGEETDGMVESLSKMQEKVKAVTGVDILTDTGAYKDTYTVLKEIGEVWQDLSDIDQAECCLYVQKCA